MKTSYKIFLQNELDTMAVKWFKSWTVARLESAREEGLKSIKSICEDAIQTAEKYKSCYFWTNTGNASDRRRQEFNSTAAFTIKGIEYSIKQGLDISCKNFYFGSHIERDGKTTNMTVIKNLLKKLNA